MRLSTRYVRDGLALHRQSLEVGSADLAIKLRLYVLWQLGPRGLHLLPQPVHVFHCFCPSAYSAVTNCSCDSSLGGLHLHFRSSVAAVTSGLPMFMAVSVSRVATKGKFVRKKNILS